MVADLAHLAGHVLDEPFVARGVFAHGMGVDPYPEAWGHIVGGHGFTTLATMARPGEFPNVLLVTVDCLRRDRLSAYGYERQTTPFLDSILDGALHCTSSHSAAPWTAPSVASLFTGLYPHSHGAGLLAGEPKNLTRQNLPTSLAAAVPILPELLPGYASAAFVGVWSAVLPLKGRLGEEHLMEEDAPRLVRAASKWMRAQNGPFFCWIHLGDAHDPLDPPRRLRDIFGPVDHKAARRWGFTGRDDDVSTEAFARYSSDRIRLYDASVRGADEAVAALWQGLEPTTRNRTILAVTSDHGEEMWEHRDAELVGFADPRGVVGVGHGHNLFQVHLLVPLIIVGPGITPAAVDANTSSVDVVPTILEAAGIRAALPALEGHSLLSIPDERPIVAEGIAYGQEKKTVILGNDKLLLSPLDGYERVFALGEDRTEAEENDDPGVLRSLRAHLPPDPGPLGDAVEADDEVANHLRGLGYIE